MNVQKIKSIPAQFPQNDTEKFNSTLEHPIEMNEHHFEHLLQLNSFFFLIYHAILFASISKKLYISSKGKRIHEEKFHH